ncbi:MAG: hypothetical protein K6E40_14275 [Desulfovibrio sp.]|nr:hypothetical protein [Desulfovibrio sp.]
MGKKFDLQDPAENMLGGGIPSAGSRMAQRSKASPAGGWAARTAAASIEKAKAEAKARIEEAARAEAEAKAKSAEAKPEEEDVARAWEKAGRPKPPAGHVLNRAFVETKSKRLQVLMQPSVYERVRAQAEATGVSVNEMISRLLVAGLEAVEG